MVHFLPTRLFSDRLIVGQDGLRCPTEHLLDRSQGDGEIEYRGAYVLNHGAAVALPPRQFGDEGRQSRPVPAAEMLGDDRAVDLSAAGTLFLVECEVSDLYGHFGEFDVLMGVVVLGIAKFTIAAAAFIGMKRYGVAGLEKLLPGTFMSFLPSRFAMGLLS